MLLVVHVGNMGAFVLNICRWHFGNPGNLDRMFILILFGEESFETNVIVYFVSECLLIDISLVKLDIVLQLGKIVASIEQKPVSLNDIVTYGALINYIRY